MTPSVSPPIRIGTAIADRIPSCRISSRCSSSRAAASISSCGMSVYSSAGPPRRIAGTPVGASGSVG